MHSHHLLKLNIGQEQGIGYFVGVVSVQPDYGYTVSATFFNSVSIEIWPKTGFRPNYNNPVPAKFPIRSHTLLSVVVFKRVKCTIFRHILSINWPADSSHTTLITFFPLSRDVTYASLVSSKDFSDLKWITAWPVYSPTCWTIILFF